MTIAPLPELNNFPDLIRALNERFRVMQATVAPPAAVAVAAPVVTAGGDLQGTYPDPTLIATGTAGTWALVTTDAAGRVAGGANGLSVTIATAKLTGGGANGLQTFIDGVLFAQTQAT